MGLVGNNRDFFINYDSIYDDIDDEILVAKFERIFSAAQVSNLVCERQSIQMWCHNIIYKTF